MNDQKMQQWVGNLLRAGVLLSAFVVAIAGIWYLATEGGTPANFSSFHSGEDMRHLSSPQMLLVAGLILLIATPIARVALSLITFALERDRTYVLITLFVLAVLIYSIGSVWW